MTKSTTPDTEIEAFFKYQKHLCNELSKLKQFPSTIGFLKKQNEKVVNDFFFNNLFMLYQSTFNLNVNQKSREDIKYMWDNLKLYHYTDSKSLEDIINGGSLKLNCILNMNDSSEGQALIEYILKNVFTMDKPINATDIPALINFVDKTHSIQHSIFSFSFTTLKDDASQWARYGKPKIRPIPKARKPTEIEKNPCGVCLEVPMKNLLKLVEKIKDDFDVAEMTPILYLPNNDTDNTFLKFVKSIVELRLQKEKSHEFAKYVTHYSSDIKHESFQKEYEVRFLLALKTQAGMIAYAPKWVNHYDTEKGRHIILNLAKKIQNFIFTDLFSSITFGPGTSAEAEKCVEDLLRNHGLMSLLHDDSKHSKCTLREPLATDVSKSHDEEKEEQKKRTEEDLL